MDTVLSLIILIFSVIIHEVSHGLMADRLGDPTARMQGRLTLNPLKHIDPVGSIIVPIVTSMFGMTFGWAKPVPYNPYNIRNRRTGEVLIALAGPASNLIIALVFGTLIRFQSGGATSVTPSIHIFAMIVLVNIILAIFNLIPLPPLDGSKLLFFLLPNQYGKVRFMLEAYAPIFIVLVVFVIWQVVTPIIPVVFRLFTGVQAF